MNEQGICTKELLKMFWQKKWVILICVAVCVAISLAMVAILTAPVYETSVVFHIKGEDSEVLVESSVYLLQTRQTLDDILEKTGLSCTREELSKMLVARPMGTTALVEVTVTSPEPNMTKAIADAVAQVLPLRMAQVMQNVETQIVDAPELPEKAVGANYMLFGLMGLLVGFALPVGVISLWEYWKTIV